MNVENREVRERSFVGRNLETLAKPAKVIGGTLLSGLAGYALAKGIDTYVMPAEPEAVFEVAVAAGFALLGGFVTAESLD